MGRRRIAAACTAVGIVAVVAGCEPAPVASPWQVDLVNVDAGGGGSGDGPSWSGVFSPDGTRLAFNSQASNLGPTDTNRCVDRLEIPPYPPIVTERGCGDVYVRDLATGAVTLVTSNAAGTDAANEDSRVGEFSADGTSLLFLSDASDLGPTDTNGRTDLYLRDLVAGTTTLLSVNASGTDAAALGSWSGVFSPDGTKVAFVSQSTDLGPTDSDTSRDLYVHDLVTGTTSLVSANAAGTDSANGDSSFGWFTADGSRVVFTSTASDLGPTDTNGREDVYVRDLVAGTTSLVSANAAGTDSANDHSGVIEVSKDGTTVLFGSDATDLGPPNRLGWGLDVYVHDLATGTTEMASVDASGADGADESVQDSDLSDDGTSVVFATGARDLGPVDDSPAPDVYLRDLAADTTTLVSHAPGGEAGNSDSSRPQLSADGTSVTFVSRSTNLLATPLSVLTYNVFVNDLSSGSTSLVSRPTGTEPRGEPRSSDPSFSPDGTRVVFDSDAADMGPVDTNGLTDVYLATLYGADLSVTLEADPEPVTSGGSVTYTAVVANGGPDEAVDGRAAVVLPVGATPVDVDSDLGSCVPTVDHPGVVLCDLAPLAPGATGEIVVVAGVTAAAGASLDVVAAVTSPAPDPVGGDTTARVVTNVVEGPGPG